MGHQDSTYGWKSITVLLATCLIGTPVVAEPADVWPQFRGPNCSGIGAAGATPPIEFGPETNVLWKTAVLPGHSSPCIWGNRIFLTAFDKEQEQLQVLCLSRRNGEILWQRALLPDELERVHPFSCPATATPATDGDQVYVYFGSYGLLAYDFDGNVVWEVPLPVPKTRFGSGTSPIVEGNLVILNSDEQNTPCLLAVDRRTGKQAWKTPQPPVPNLEATSYSTPVIWRDQLVVHRTGEIVAYSPDKGERIWSLGAVSTGKSTPVIAGDLLIVATWNGLGEPEQRVDLPDFLTLARQYDKNSDKQLDRQEFPGDLALARRPEVGEVPGGTVFVRQVFNSVDTNADGSIGESEWKKGLDLVSSFSREHGLLAIRVERSASASEVQVDWRIDRCVPEVPSPLYYYGHVYMIKNGGVISCMDAEKGTLLYRKRLGALGPYYSSPVVAGGNIYAASGEGVITVLRAGDQLEVLARNDLGEPIFATPAVVGNTLYVRSSIHMYAFADGN